MFPQIAVLIFAVWMATEGIVSSAGSTASNKSNETIKKPINVDYVMEFLESYIPNKKINSSKELATRRRKREVGTTPSITKGAVDPWEKPLPISTGPGWVELRLPRMRLKQPLEHNLSYRPVGAKEYYKVEPVRFVRRWGDQELSVPLTPCPSWVADDLFCIVISDGIKVSPNTFVDYEGTLTSKEISGDEVENSKQESTTSNQGKEDQKKLDGNRGQKKEDKAKKKSVTINFVFRVYECDPTINKLCPAIGRKPQGLPVRSIEEELAILKILGIDVPHKWILFLRSLWPVYWFLLIFLMMVGLPCIFIRAKRVAEREALIQLLSEEQLFTTIEPSNAGHKERRRRGSSAASSERPPPSKKTRTKT